jgi:membrane dipeptidase
MKSLTMKEDKIRKQLPCPDGGITRRQALKTLFASASLSFIAQLLCQGNLLAEAAEISSDSVTVDLHCHANLLSSPNFPEVEISIAENMRAGGLDAGVFAVRGDYPVIRRNASGLRYQWRQPKSGELFHGTLRQLDKILEVTSSEKLILARSPAEVIEAKNKNAPCAMLAIEGGDPLEGEVSRLKLFHDRGVRVVQLVHYRINEIGDIQTEAARHNELTSFGRSAVQEINRLGMVIDTAHCSPDTLYGVLAVSRHPVIYSHTGPRAMRKLSRHLDDKEMQAIASKGGVIGVWPLRRRRDTFETFLREVDYVTKLVGADHVGIGTDLFGLRDRTAVPTHKEFALIPAGLLNRGYAPTDIAKIVGGNFMRIFRQVSDKN